MIVFPTCKINIGLYVTEKRPDGYHTLETVFYPVHYKDALEVVPATSGENSLHITGREISGSTEDNLCRKAWRLLQRDFPELPLVDTYLHKAIPMGAGLGGGSSDGAFMLSLLNDFAKLGLSKQELQRYALQLGSDCPFFIENKPCYATGRGEQMHFFTEPLPAFEILVVNPGLHISTAESFKHVPVQPTGTDLRSLPALPAAGWKDAVQNDFEPYAFEKYPILADIKSILYEQGAFYASMTGTGSSIYGLFEKRIVTERLFHPDHTVFWG